MFNSVKYESFAEMGNNPASVEMGTKDLIINKDRFPKLPKFTQKFIIEHEKGHLLYDTDSEELADKHALHSLYKTENRSLKKSVKALVDILPEDNKRIETLYNEALNLDKGGNNMNRQFNFNNFLAGSQPFNNLRTIRRNASGDCCGDVDCTDENCVTNGNRNRKRYIEVFGYEMTIGELAMVILCLITLFKILK